MNLKQYVPHGLGAVALGALLFAGWLWRHDAAVTRQALAAQQRQAVEAQANALDSVKASYVPILAALRADSAQLAQREATYRARWIQASTTISATQARLDSALAATQDAGLRAVVAARLHQDSLMLAGCSLALAAADSGGTVCERKAAIADSLLLATQTVLDSTRAALKVTAKVGRPSLFGQVRSGLPWLAAGVLAGMFLKP